MATEQQLPPGLFLREGVFYVKKQIRGREHKKSTGKRDFKSALRRYHEIMKAWNDGASGWDTKAPTFVDYWKDYRAAYTVRKTPMANGEFFDDSRIKVALDDLGRYRLDEFSKSMCQRWANKRRRMSHANNAELQLSEGTVTRELGLLQAVFQQAIEDGLLDKNPWRKVERADYVPNDRVLTLDEQAKLESVISPAYQRWLHFMLGTGLRVEESRGIDPARDVDFSQRWVRVTRKTRGLQKKIQLVPLIDSFLLDVLQEQLTEVGVLWPQTQARLWKLLASACEKTGVEHISPHTLRHTFATRYLKGGGDIYILSKILGHSSVAVTEKVYAHLLGEDLLLRSRGVNLGLRPSVPGKVIQFPAAASSE